MCSSSAIEDEEHFIGRCRKLKCVRDMYKAKYLEKELDVSTINIECIKNMLSPDFVKLTSDMLLELFELRKKLMYDIIRN